MWVAHIPVITERTGVTHDQLGGLLLLIGAAAFIAMQLCGPLIDRWGSTPTTIISGVLLSAAVIGPVVATSPATLAVALAGFGFANGGLDVSMNAQAVQVERAYGQPIMSAFHGCFSIGSLIGSIIVAVTLWLSVGVVLTVVIAALAGLVLLVVVAGGLVPRGYPDRTAADVRATSDDDASPARWWTEVHLGRLALLALVAFALMLAEGTAYDWSALHVVETFGTREAVGAIAFGAFSAAMTIARFGIDRVAGALGPVAVVRYGALVGALGMTIAVTAPVAWVAIAGWTIFGLGLAGLIPQIFTAAGNLTTASSGRMISTVVGCGYLGMLSGPAVVGFLSARTGLPAALTVAIVALVLAAAAAGVVRPRRAITMNS